jgi:hypothetical protein
MHSQLKQNGPTGWHDSAHLSPEQTELTGAIVLNAALTKAVIQVHEISNSAKSIIGVPPVSPD